MNMKNSSAAFKLHVYIDCAVGTKNRFQDIRQRNILFSPEVLGFFQERHISMEEILPHKLADQKEPVLAVFGNEDLHEDLHRQLLQRKNKGYLTIPLVIFSDSFFVLPEGEKLGYADILDAVSSDCDYNAVAFKESQAHPENQQFCKYLQALAFFMIAEESNRRLAHEIAVRTELLRGILKEPYNFLERQQICIYAGILCEDIRKREAVMADNNRHMDSCIGTMEEVQEKNGKSIAVSRFPYALNSSGMSLRLVLKYGEAIQKITEYLDMARKYEIQSEALAANIQETKKRMQEYMNVALVGTFSSGKTCFINTLVSHPKKLRTSAGHNTAVLMEFRNAAEDTEKVVLKYRDRAESTLLEGDIRRPQFYDGEPGYVEAVDKDRRQVRVRDKEGKLHTIGISNSREITVKPGDAVKTGDVLTDGDKETVKIKRFKLVSRQEIREIAKRIKEKWAEEVCMTVKYSGGSQGMGMGRKESQTLSVRNIHDSSTVLRYLSALEKYASNKESTVKADDISAESKFEAVSSITITYRPASRERTISLDDRTWQMFSGAGTDEIFVESPACYLNCEKLEFYLKSDFLQFCTLIDTPGLGSVTEKHDAITERYIRLQQSLLIVMLRVDIHARSSGYFWLLNLINSVYENNRYHKDDVIFIFNCYEDSFRDKEKSVRELCDDIVRDITQYGFSKKNIYACNLKKVMENKEVKEYCYGYPSYKPFESRMRREVERRGPNRMLGKVNAMWNDFFLNEIAHLNQQIETLTGNEEKRNQEIKACDKMLEEIKKIKIPDFSEAVKELDSKCTQTKNDLDENVKKKEWKENFQDIVDLVNEINELEDKGCMAMRAGMYQIQEYYNQEEPMEVTEFNFTFSTSAFENEYKKVLDEFPVVFYKKRYSDEKRASLKNFIDQEVKKTRNNYKEHYRKSAGAFQRYQTNAENSLKKYRNDLENVQENRDNVRKYQDTLRKLKELKEKWDKVASVVEDSAKEKAYG